MVNDQATLIESQNEKIANLEYYLDKKDCKIENLMDKIKDLKSDLKIALDDKDYYKSKCRNGE